MPDLITLLLVAYVLFLPTLAYILLVGGRASADGTRVGAAYAALTAAPAAACGALLGPARGAAALEAADRWGARRGMPAAYVVLLGAVAATAQALLVPRLGGVWGDAAPPAAGVWWAGGGGGGDVPRALGRPPAARRAAGGGGVGAAGGRRRLAPPPPPPPPRGGALPSHRGIPPPAAAGALPLCHTCRRRKPARSKHSPLTGTCVAVYDHYCGWVANDVGALNRRLFLLFLAVHVGAFAHGAAVCASVTRAALGAAVARSAFRVRGGVRLDAAAAARLDAVAAVQLALYVCGPVVVVGAAFAVLAAVLGAFMAWHVKMVARAETTNENAKWAAVADARAVWDAAHGAGAFVAALRAERRGGRGGGWATRGGGPRQRV
ncbi:hypothetical protein BU14_0052s0071 [Porphyra umbilicalis]|uniref:Palmitoyltransferase n=1 Tax=Porphyra umbilicalis TaxID=2786 RepID=A0A1X6PHZ7_PORUM|nr:hypothetical protein BU14_0052s0071 [Porphyra umbilicalis]|eukprot:OSX80457.1 hypothetical protein BU14_0052s0071 [Porphyra umbilicalis]